MVADRQFKFGQKVTSSGFSKDLSRQVDAYFQQREISRHANLEMVAKTLLSFTL